MPPRDRAGSETLGQTGEGRGGEGRFWSSAVLGWEKIESGGEHGKDGQRLWREEREREREREREERSVSGEHGWVALRYSIPLPRLADSGFGQPRLHRRRAGVNWTGNVFFLLVDGLC
jgi:hypothetical protein